jgi:diguanylate cyclase (GGDEF)-like protein/putative nucleotidyltransferase with HDIG domain
MGTGDLPAAAAQGAPASGDELTGLRALLEAVGAVRAGGGLEPLLEGLAGAISASLRFATVVVNIYRPAWDDFEVATVHGGDAVRRALQGTTRRWDGWRELLDPRFERCGTYMIPEGEYDWDGERDAVSYRPQIRSSTAADAWRRDDALFVPLRAASGSMLGIVSVDEPIDGRRPSDTQLEVLSAVAAHAALAIERAQAIAEADAHRSAVQHLLRVSARLTGRRSVEEMLSAVCEGIREALGFQRVIVALTDGPDHRLMLRASLGWSEDERSVLPPVPLSSISRLVRPENQREGCILLTREEAEALTPADLHHVHRGRRNGRGPLAWRRHWLIVPLHDRDGAFTGIVWVDEPADYLLPTPERLQTLRAFANQAISAVDSARQLERLRRLVEQDPLTGLRNRRGFEDRVRAEIGRLPRDASVSVLVCDLDDFRRVNDALGQDAGDEVLRRFADVVCRTTGDRDGATRLGGEEFAALLHGADGEGALEIAERLRLAIHAEFADLPVRVSVSVGVAAAAPELSTAEELIRAANRALHAAKRLGRDRSLAHGPDAAGLIDGPLDCDAGGGAELAAALLLAESLDGRGRHTARHSTTVGLLAEQTARRLGWEPARIERVRAAGVLHDIGKTAIADAILDKPTALEPPEWAEIRRHPELGARILEHAGLRDIAGWVLAHHERPDGLGYPHGLRGPAIPAEALVLGTADAYEAMTSDRAYRRAAGPLAAETELRRCAGTQFDPGVIEALIAAVDSVAEDGTPSPV